MNMWRRRGTPAITPQTLLPAEFFGKEARRFKTKEDWEKYKKEVTKMARWHSHILREIKSGKRKIEKTINFSNVGDVALLRKDSEGR